jgi:hypothetical protein
MQQYADIYLLQSHCTCFGCPQHPSSGVLKTVTASSGTATSLQRGLIRPRWSLRLWPNEYLNITDEYKEYNFALRLTVTGPFYSRFIISNLELEAVKCFFQQKERFVTVVTPMERVFFISLSAFKRNQTVLKANNSIFVFIRAYVQINTKSR